jgi:hypothetical protein
MSVRRPALATLVVLAALAGACSRSVDVSESSDPKVVSPQWVQEGLALARKSTPKPLRRADLPDVTTTIPPPAPPTYQLPPEAEFTAALGTLGLDAASAACVYNGIVGTPLAETVGRLLTSATNPIAAVTDPATADAASVSEATQRQLLVALAPCLDTNMLLTVLAAVTGTGPSGAGSINALLASVVSSATGPLPKLDASALAKTAGINLTPAQITALTNAIAAAQAAATVDTSNIDFSKLDVSKLSKEQVITLLAALLKGLTPAQAAQLNALTAIDLKSLNLDIEPGSLSNQQAGALFVLLLPFISAGVAAPTGPPPGFDPGQIYIPPGTDLSSINPLNFITRDNMIESLGKEYGIAPAQAGCIYDRVRVIDPRLLGEAYLGRSEQGAAQLAFALIGCVIAA